MRKEVNLKSKTLAGVSDLTLFATIRQGFVPSLESVTYKTRLQMLLKTLSASRASSLEYSLLRPFSDAVERVGVIHSVRLAIVEPENKLMLAVTFDGAWENYIRTLWLKVGTLLDVIFCNTEDYVVAHDHSFDAWAAWARRVQVETQFFYGVPALTVADVQVLRNTERIYRSETSLRDRKAVTAAVRRPEDLAWEAATGGKLPPDPLAEAEAVRQGLQALAVLYRLAELYLPGTPDGDILLRAARDLLLEVVEMQSLDRLLLITQGPRKPLRDRFDRQLRWFLQPTPERARRLPEPTPYDRNDVQGGILTSPEATHGCLLLLAFPEDRAVAAAFLGKLIPLITRDDTAVPTGQATRTVALSFEGLRALGLSEAELADFPEEFRLGMEARASVLGDLRTNHPRRWRLPLRSGLGAPPTGERVELTAVHMVLQLRVNSPLAPSPFDDVADPTHPLNAEVAGLLRGSGVRLLSVQPLWRNRDTAGQAREHFGFVDGISQPSLEPNTPGSVYDNRVHLGDILLGHANTFDAAPPVHPLLHNGSFLVVRKLRQDVPALNRTLDAACHASGLSRADVLAKMMGRHLDGQALVPTGPAGPNDFNYAADPQGRACPFQSHVRRTNPRELPAPRTPRETPSPRILRRGMSYGPRFDEALPADHPNNTAERGVMFMAYNARIAEQFELIQRWVSGGNSSGALSAHSDPFLGVPQRGDARNMRFIESATHPKVQRVALDDAAALQQDPPAPPMVRLEWGAYLFTPSIKALQRLQQRAAAPMKPPQAVWSADEGEQIIRRLQALPPGQTAAAAWKHALEDPTEKREHRCAAVWAAIREHHGGVLRTPHGVLVASSELVNEVFVDSDHRYTVKGYKERTGLSFGEIYLGLDRDVAGGPYDTEATLSNLAIQSIGFEAAFRQSEGFARQILQERMALDKALASGLGKPAWELNLDTKEVSDHVLARLSEEWFGLPGSGRRLEPGSLRWDWQEGEPVLYPGHFTAPSRYVFQPAPGECPMRLGQRHGHAIRAAVRAFAQDHHAAGTRPTTPSGAPAVVGEAIFCDPRGNFSDPAEPDTDWIARTFAGALVGFLPSVDGNFRATLNEWLRDGDFWRLRSAWSSHPGTDSFTKANELLLDAMLRTMQLRPSPEQVWRRARKPHRLGTVDVVEGEQIVVAIVSATQADLLEGRSGVFPVFGGERSPLGPQPGHAVHACPGYAAGMGALLGMYSAFMGIRESVRPSPAPLSLTIVGRTSP